MNSPSTPCTATIPATTTTKRARRPANLRPRPAQRRNQEPGNDRAINPRLRRQSRRNGKRHRQRQRHQANGHSGNHIQQEFVPVIPAQTQYRLRQPVVIQRNLALPALVRSQTTVHLANRWAAPALQDPPACEHDRRNCNSLGMAGALVPYHPTFRPAQKIALSQPEDSGHRRCGDRRPRGSRRASDCGNRRANWPFRLQQIHCPGGGHRHGSGLVAARSLWSCR
jgi:hypothetical protein